MKLFLNNNRFVVFILFFTFIFSFEKVFSGTYPKQLEKVARSIEMTPLYDFEEFEMDDDQKDGPTYIIGASSGEMTKCDVFWAWKIVGGKKKYYLVVNEEKSAFCGCPKIIEYWNTPAKLSMYKNEKIKMTGFNCLTNKKLKIPKYYSGDGEFIRVGSDSLDLLFYCYKNSWWVLMRC